eukprot:5078420-Prymnesium_polylepis.3
MTLESGICSSSSRGTPPRPPYFMRRLLNSRSVPSCDVSCDELALAVLQRSEMRKCRELACLLSDAIVRCSDLQLDFRRDVLELSMDDELS